jgi:UDP-glucose 4-epimerase
VVDLADSHVVALKHLNTFSDSPAFDVLNVGAGKGTSVLEIVQAFERVTDVSLRYTIGERREGDVVEIYADASKIKNILGWQASKTLDDALLSAWNWEKKLRGIS